MFDPFDIYEVRVEEGPTAAGACSLCMRVTDEPKVLTGPADLVCMRCATRIRKALNAFEGISEATGRVFTLKEVSLIAGIPVEDVEALA